MTYYCMHITQFWGVVLWWRFNTGAKKKKKPRQEGERSFFVKLYVKCSQMPTFGKHWQSIYDYFILFFFLRKTSVGSRHKWQILLAWEETRWGRKKAPAEEKSSNLPVSFDTVLQIQNGYLSRNLTKCAGFDGNWYRQWPAAGSAGCLAGSREAYEMTLKLSSTTITFEGGRGGEGNVSHSVGTYVCKKGKSVLVSLWLFIEVSRDVKEFP